MAEIDLFANQLLEEAKSLFEKARLAANPKIKDSFLHAALNLGFCALEAHVNSIAEDFLTLSDLTPQESSILAEKKAELIDGQFKLTNKLQIYRLEDRLLFLCRRFSKKGPLDKKAVYWGQFRTAQDLRNRLTHPKAPSGITEKSVEQALYAIIQLLDAVFKRIYGKRFPGLKRGLQSTIEL